MEKCRIDVEVCPHLSPHFRLSPASALLVNEDIDQTSWAWLESHDPRFVRSEPTGREVFRHCRKCPTDYSCSATPDVFTCCTWHDLGQYTSPLDVAWDVHHFGPSNTRRHGPVVSLVQGDVRARYLRVETKQNHVQLIILGSVVHSRMSSAITYPYSFSPSSSVYKHILPAVDRQPPCNK